MKARATAALGVMKAFLVVRTSGVQGPTRGRLHPRERRTAVARKAARLACWMRSAKSPSAGHWRRIFISSSSRASCRCARHHVDGVPAHGGVEPARRADRGQYARPFRTGCSPPRATTDRLFNHYELKELAAQQRSAALVAPAGVLDVSYTPQAIEFILDKTQGYPYFISGSRACR